MGEEVKVDVVKLFGVWSSPYSRRIELALKVKDIPFEYVEEDLSNKSTLLLRYNPVHKMIPILVHNGNPIVESLIILEYIDEIWKDHPLLPRDPYERAQTRFWARFIDDKVTNSESIPFFVIYFTLVNFRLIYKYPLISNIRNR